MSRSQEAAKARDIIRRRQERQEEDSTGWLTDPSTTSAAALSPHTRELHPPPPPPSATRQHHQQQQQPQQLPVRITISDRESNSEEAPPHIYSVPTTDTYGDDSFTSRSYTIPTPPRSNHYRSDAIPFHRSPPPPQIRSTTNKTSYRHQSHYHPTTTNSTPSSLRRFRRTTGRSSKNKKQGEFQHEDDYATVRVQTVNTAQRSAYEKSPPLSLELWKRIAEQQGAGAGLQLRRTTTNMSKRISPSYRHLKLLHTMQSMNVIRQVQFSPSTCQAADFFLNGWWDTNSNSDRAFSPNMARRPKRDGRYRSIDPVLATVAVLPQTPPILSNKKLRLPRRSDVGFPNASIDEMQLKQKEIADETEWEEASPRLVVLVTSDDLGRAVQDDDSCSTGSDGSSIMSRRCCSTEHLQFNGGGLEGIPFAGRELIQAKERNARHFGQPGCAAQLIKFLSPDPYSMLAPPLDSTYSQSQGWRPRPFHDRPAGMRYVLVSPLSVSFAAGDLEPLVCSLALYTLPVGSNALLGKLPHQAFGKMSEEFWFPAGDWSGKVELDVARREDGSIDPTLVDALMRRKTKAIFSFDPIAVSSPSSIFVVLQVFQLSHECGCEPYLRSKIQKTQQAPEEEYETARNKANRVFQQFGTQLLSPLCFGLVQMFPSHAADSYGGDTMKWPQGEPRQMNFHCYPAISESHDAFVSRLAAVASHKRNQGQSMAEDNRSTVSDAAFSTASSEATRKKRGVSRLFKVNAKQSRSSAVVELDVEESASLDGNCQLFVSSLDSDFLQAMLATPSELETECQTNMRLPRLLVDVSGDLAVLLDLNSESLPSNDSPLRKRSNLLRLPFSGEPAGYVCTSEFREVYYLPARPEKHYDVDTGLSYRSLLNLLYLYPRLLRPTTADAQNFYLSQFTIRVQVFQSQSNVEEESGRVTSTSVMLTAFHNPAPWSGPALLDQIYTKIFGSSISSSSLSVDMNSGIPIRDEIKLRLPLVLDGSYSMRFELYSLLPGSDVSLQLVADAVIPLSSSLSRDAGRVATIIPNGNHRLKLGEFQLQLETRLVSAIHIGDPSVATVLRDFPCAKGSAEGRAERKLASVSVPSVDETEDFDASFPLMLAEASQGAVICHFEVLLYIHLCNLVNVQDRSDGSPGKAARFMMGNMLSLFEVLRKVKGRFLGSHNAGRQEELKAFIKKHVDLFDERYLSLSSSSGSPSSDRVDAEADSASEVLQIEQSASQDEMTVKEVDEPKHEGAIRIRSKSERYSYRSSRTFMSSGAPFSRVAYGASKIDRMRIEAELHSQEGMLSHFFDDDETIMTSPTLQTTTMDPYGTENQRLHPLLRGRSAGVASSDNSIVPAASASPHVLHETGMHRSTGSGAEFAQKVRTVAQVMLAPCVGPSLSNILAKSSSPQNASKDKKETEESTKHPFHSLPTDAAHHCLPDSDADEEGDTAGNESFDTSILHSTSVTTRGPPDGPMFLFSVRNRSSHEMPVSCGDFIYESIVLLWLSAWLDHVEASLLEPSGTSGGTGKQFATFPIPEYHEISASDRPIFSYYAHMDILLPLCLKSVILRYSVEVLPAYPPATRAMVDENHMVVLEPFVEMLARGLLGQALSGLGSPDTRDKALVRALASSEVVLDFLVGLLSVLHPEHMNSLLKIFFGTLRDCETEHLQGNSFADDDFEWSEESLQRVRSSRQLRLRAVEALAVLPSFLALNYPPRYTSGNKPPTPRKATWIQQYSEIMVEPTTRGDRLPFYADGLDRLPPCRWLAELVLSEALSVCSLSCEAVVAEAIAHIEVSSSNKSKKVSLATPSLKKRPGAALKRGDLLMFQSIAIHAITCVYELILRRHAMDKRFQTDSCRERIAGLFAGPILDKSLSASRWLARMESTHKVRSIWLLCLVYILQEAPISMIRDYMRSLCNPSDVKIHRFIRLLRLSSSTFQSFVDLPRHANFPSQIDKGLSPWLLQESFNTVVAATIMVVEECAHLTASYPHEQEKMMTGILDLLLHLLSTPQSSVTHLRAVGGALQALEQFGVELFLDITGASLQHWIRVILSLMNSTSLSVRSIAVDFVVSLLGSMFDLTGDIDFISIIFVSVLPEVAAREIALCSVSGNITTSDDMSRSLWPLRRALADLEDSNPLDDDRVDNALVPILSVFCRACQAVIDGVLIELRLRGDGLSVVGTRILRSQDVDTTFDADEESLYEAATFFAPETAPMQRLRWLLTLKSLHEAKGQWVEAAETLFLCSRTITDSMRHAAKVWRASKFVLWSDSRRSLWLDTVGEDLGHPDRGNTQVMEFAEEFLEPSELLGTSWKALATGKLRQPSVSIMSLLLGQIVKDAVKFYQLEEGMDELAHMRLESLLKATMNVLECHSVQIPTRTGPKAMGAAARKRHMEDETCLRRVLASISGELTKMAERLLDLVQNEPNTGDALSSSPAKKHSVCRYVVLRLSGKKPTRFQESTSLPTFLEFDTPCICRLPASLLQSQSEDEPISAEDLSLRFARPLVAALNKECDSTSAVLVTETPSDYANDESVTYLHIYPVDSASASIDSSSKPSLLSKSFFYRKSVGEGSQEQSTVVEMKVVHEFPCALSRQRAVLTTEIGFQTMDIQ